MSIHTVIKRRRKELGFTQEQIADYLGVSTPAVNKWESGTTCPDIALLPPLARLLRMDLNTLLCFNESLTEQEMNHFLMGLTSEMKKRGIDSTFSMAEAKVREYPNGGLLIHSTAMTLDGILMMSGMTAEEKGEYENRIISLYEQAAKGDDDKIRIYSRFMLASKYMAHEEYEEAQEILDVLPEPDAIDKRLIQSALFVQQGRFGEAASILESRIFSDITMIQSILVQLTDIALKEGNREAAVHAAEVSRKSADLFGLWDYYQFLGSFSVAVADQDVPESISLLKSLLATTELPWNFGHSPLYRHLDLKLKGKSVNPEQPVLLKPFLAELEHTSKYEFLHTASEFRRLMEEYRAKIRTAGI